MEQKIFWVKENDFTKKTRFKPLYKQFVKLNEDVQGRDKITRFRKQKWRRLISRIKYKRRRYVLKKPISQTGYVVSKFPNTWNSHKKGAYRLLMFNYKKIKLLYGGFNKKGIKKIINQTYLKTKKNNSLHLIFLRLLESRLDTVIFRAKFSRSMRGARQLIVHEKVLVNNKKVKSKSFILQPGDLVSFIPESRRFVEASLAFSRTWPIPPKHLIINYKTFQIIMGIIDHDNASSYFNFPLELYKLLVRFRHIK